MTTEKVEDFTNEFEVEDAIAGTAQQTQPEQETDPYRIAQRQKQIDFGKNTVGYQLYRQAIPKNQRRRGHPRTPDVHQKTSKRAFDGQVKKWRRQLHEWDPPTTDQQQPQEQQQTNADESKNQQGDLQSQQQQGLPLKIPSAMRPITKRTRSHQDQINNKEVTVLTSPTSRPPAAKQAKTWADAVKTMTTMTATTQGVVTVLGNNNNLNQSALLDNHAKDLMMKWKEMKTEQQRDSADGHLMAVGVVEEVCYSDDDDGGVVVGDDVAMVVV